MSKSHNLDVLMSLWGLLALLPLQGMEGSTWRRASSGKMGTALLKLPSLKD